MDSLQKIIEEMREWRHLPADADCALDWASRLDALQGEPVAVVEDWPDDYTRLGITALIDIKTLPIGTKLYAAPQQADGADKEAE